VKVELIHYKSGCLWHHLHESESTYLRTGFDSESAFHVNDGKDEDGIELVVLTEF
jgi:hypothetical protein